jgi:hypothetical protein
MIAGSSSRHGDHGTASDGSTEHRGPVHIPSHGRRPDDRRGDVE